MDIQNVVYEKDLEMSSMKEKLQKLQDELDLKADDVIDLEGDVKDNISVVEVEKAVDRLGS